MSANQEKYQNQIDAYFRNELSDQERISFEKLLKEDTELSQEFIIHKELYAQFDPDLQIDITSNAYDKEVEEIETYFESEEAKKLSEVIDKAQHNYQEAETPKKWPNKNIFIGLIAAASVALLVVLYTTNSGSSTQELYAQYSDWNDLPSLTSRKDGDQLSLGQSLFEEGKYQQANTVFKTILTQGKEVPPSVLIYSGVSALELDDYQEALTHFDQLMQSDTIDHSKGYWYKALVFLKQAKKDEAIAVLKRIVENKENFNYKEAVILLDKLK